MVTIPTSPQRTPTADLVVAESAAMRDLARDVQNAARALTDLLIVGEPGTGRERIARAVHAQRPNAAAPFFTVDCAAAEPSLDLLLFGVPLPERRTTRPELPQLGPNGLLAVDQATLFLRRITHASLRTQGALARVLRTRDTTTVQGEMIKVTARVLVAVEPAFDAALNAGEMRADLYRHLAAARLEVPPLRRRREDIPHLVRQFLAMETAGATRGDRTVTPAALSLLSALPWRGNVRELEALVRKVSETARGRTIGVDDLLVHIPLATEAPALNTAEPLKDARARFERQYITAVLDQCRWRIPLAARSLGMARPNLYRRMRALGIPTTGRSAASPLQRRHV